MCSSCNFLLDHSFECLDSCVLKNGLQVIDPYFRKWWTWLGQLHFPGKGTLEVFLHDNLIDTLAGFHQVFPIPRSPLLLLHATLLVWVTSGIWSRTVIWEIYPRWPAVLGHHSRAESDGQWQSFPNLPPLNLTALLSNSHQCINIQS